VREEGDFEVSEVFKVDEVVGRSWMEMKEKFVILVSSDRRAHNLLM